MKIGVLIMFILFACVFTSCEREKTAAPTVKKIAGVEREVFNFEKYPALTAVGKINFIGQRWCSLTLVAEDIAISAGHCFLEDYLLSDLSKEYKPHWAVVTFRQNGVKRIDDLYVKRVLKAEMNPDYAIIRLNRKVTEIKPLKISKLSLNEMLSSENNLGCAGFNGDKELGDEGWTMTISRNIKIIPETSSKDRIDANCFSTYGGSGGLFFNEKYNAATEKFEYDLIGVVWGVTDEKLNEKGELIKNENITTSITPVSIFYNELTEIIGKN